uniref:Secreted protein n=1 Tax=Parascaris equorum TaxID=6256 RepID=A0A914RNR0_PAREQ
MSIFIKITIISILTNTLRYQMARIFTTWSFHTKRIHTTFKFIVTVAQWNTYTIFFHISIAAITFEATNSVVTKLR